MNRYIFQGLKKKLFLLSSQNYGTVKLKKFKTHLEIGEEQDLLFFHKYSPGSCFFTIYGTNIFNSLIQLMKDEYKRQEVTEVLTPTILKTKVWKNNEKHWDHHHKCTHEIPVKSQNFGVKHTNSHNSCLMFSHFWDSELKSNLSKFGVKSYRELPVRYAEFSVLHKDQMNSSSNCLRSLTRFQRDSQNHFCLETQFKDELDKFLFSVKNVFKTLSLEPKINLYKKCSSPLDEYQMRDKLFDDITRSIINSDIPFNTCDKESSSCGPDFDIIVTDNFNREFKCGYFQIDFELANKFRLSYNSPEGLKSPVYFHCSIYGSVENIFSILAEHFEGDWPFWLSPKQVVLVPQHSDALDYLEDFRTEFLINNIKCEIANNTLGDPSSIESLQKEYKVVLIINNKLSDNEINVYDEKVKVFKLFRFDDVRNHVKESNDSRVNFFNLDLLSLEKNC